MPKISDEELERWSTGIPFGSEIALLAHELLAARKVVEVAQDSLGWAQKHKWAADWVDPLHYALTAYNEATHD